jgi:nucleoid DNA-binding protein
MLSGVMARVTKKDVLELVSRKAHLPRKAVVETVELFLDEIARHLSKGDEVLISGFGKFRVEWMDEKTVVIPKTTDKVKIPRHRTPKFTPGNKLRRLVTK